jgi:hypothetical protein
MEIYRPTDPRIGSTAGGRVVAQVPRAWSDRRYAVVDEAMLGGCGEARAPTGTCPGTGTLMTLRTTKVS